MHQLYLHFLACKGAWKSCTLVVSVRKRMQNQRRELYEFWDYKTMVDKLGQTLADDLKNRHIREEEALPPNKKGMFIIKRLNCIVLYSGFIMHVCFAIASFQLCWLHGELTCCFSSCASGTLTFQTRNIYGDSRTLLVSPKRRSGNTRQKQNLGGRLMWMRKISMTG